MTPVASRPSETTNSEAMNRTVGSPNPLSAAVSDRMPVAHSASATPIATMPTGTRPETNRTTAAARIR